MIPKLRFPEFKDAFQSISLQSIVDKPISYGIVQAGEEVPEGMPYIKSSDLNSEINLRCLSRTSEEIAFKYRRSEVKSGDIIFSLRGNLGTTRIVPDEIKVANLTQGTARISLNESFYNHHIHFTLSSPSIQRKIAAVSKGSTFKEITLDDLRKLSLYVPNNQLEQRKIAKLFVFVDQKINLLTKKKEALETYKKGLTQKIFSQELRFKREDGTDYPEWETLRIEDISEERSERGFDDYRLLSITLHNGIVPQELGGKSDSSSSDKSNYKLVKIGDIGYNSMRMWQGASGVSSFEGIVSPAYTVFKLNERADAQYVGYLFKTHRLISTFKSHSQGLTSDTWNLKYPTLKRIKITLPSIGEQLRVVRILNQFDVNIESLNKRIKATEQLKKGLLQQMFV